MKSTNIFVIVVTLCHLLIPANTANILSLVEVLTPEQQLWHDAVYRGLLSRGHKLTVVSGSRLTSKPPGVAQIHLEDVKAVLDTNKPPKLFTNPWLSPFERVIHWCDRQMKICKAVLSSSGLQELIELSRQAEPFDLIIYDATYGPSCLLALAQLFENIPIVAVSTSYITPDLLKVARGTHIQPATVPHFTTVHNEHMNFLERLHNTIVYAMASFFRQFTVESVHEALLAKSEELQEAHMKLGKIIDRIKVVLVNSHPATDYVHALPANVIEVGGLQFDNVNRPLSVEMQGFIDNSEGVFIITLGSQGNINELKHDVIEVILNTIDSLPEYDFIWGVDKLPIPTESRPNLFVGKWLKKSNIFAQRKVKGFISGGSHMDVQSAVYYGVPIIGIPGELYQPNAAQRAQALGFGIRVDLSSDPQKLYSAINTIYLEPTFKENAKSRQAAFRNRPRDPLDEAMWWIEYVLSHPVESDYLFSRASADTSFFVIHSLDAISVLVFMLAMFFVNCYFVLKHLIEYWNTKGQHEIEAKSEISKRKLKKSNSNKKKSQ
ncbi:UDP-glucuronosyltransferase 2B1 [Anastrepha ludens]|uniref:UDP-glucuronosyltransferase 2B1 n=1 Tax=Anastrepha ludens TaxID=28586 RepID=UPI0023AE6E19|nr:UDP-glucuronosyltransferase 2B1 [Anastrepha ludens]